jgi:hypothetical protein
MAKVINPLLSGSASGQLGHMMTFDKRGFVRQYVVPSNPNSVAQQDVRNTLGDIQRVLKQVGVVLRTQLKSQFGYRWGSLIIGELMATNNAVLSAYEAEYAAFIAGDKTVWATQDTSGAVKIADGAALYAVTSAAYDIALRIGATITLPLPATANAAAVKTAWIANA